MRNGGVVCVSMWEGKEMVVRKAVGRICSSFEAEAMVMREAGVDRK